MAGSLFLVLLGYFNWFNLDDIATRVIERIDFKDFLLNGILGFLLFAGALGIKLPVLNNQNGKLPLSLCSQRLPPPFLLVFYFMALPYFSGWHIDLIYCILFGALISPDDPDCRTCHYQKLKSTKALIYASGRRITF